MSYDPNIPTAGSSPASSVTPIRVNFQQLSILLDKDHVGPTASAGSLRHKKVTLFNTASPGAQVDPSSVVYSKNVTVGGVSKPQLFFKNSDADRQITSAQVNRPTWPYWAFGRVELPSLSLVGQFGTTSAVVRSFGGIQQGWTITMSTPAPSTGYVVLLTPKGLGELNTNKGYSLIYSIVNESQFRVSYRNEAGEPQPLLLSGFSYAVLVN